MITYAAIEAQIAKDWEVIRRLCKRVHRSSQVGMVFHSEARPEESYNLPLVLAYSSLDDVLKQLAAEKGFERDGGIDARMKSSRSKLTWENYKLVDEGRVARNWLAHEGALLDRTDCLKFITARMNFGRGEYFEV